MSKERSRAYPGIDLETAEGILRRQLATVGSETLERPDLASRLGYSSGKGGTGARKIAALVHYGLVHRSSDRFRLGHLGQKLLTSAPGSPKASNVLRSALEHPVLFRGILERYQPEGRIPSSLAEVLTSNFGITVRASLDAADIFLRSARFAGILAEDGRFLEAIQEMGEHGIRKRLELLLPGRKSAWLDIPDGMSRKDLVVLTQALEVQLAQLSIHLGLEESAEIRQFRKRATTLRLTNAEPSQPPKN
jgi:hypothetical protein